MRIRRHRFSPFDVLNYLVFLILMLVCVYPFYYMFINTISSPSAIARGDVIFLPREVHLQNYANIIAMPAIYRATFISLARTILGTILTIFSCSFFGFLVLQQALPFRRFIYRFVVITMFFNAGLIPWFIVMKMLGMQNNFLLYILPSAVIPFYLILFKTYIEHTIPPSVQESAYIDGAGHFTVFARIIFPLSTPIVATIAVFAAVGQWNTFIDTLFLVREPRLLTLQMLLYQYLQQVEAVARAIRSGGISTAARQGGYQISPIAVRMTVSMIVVFPILIVYPVLQRYFVKGIMIGAIKG